MKKRPATPLVNLLPWRERRRTIRRRAFFGSLAATVATAAGLVALAGWRINEQTAQERRQSHAVADRVAALDVRIAAQEALLGERDELAALAEALEDLGAERPLLAATLDELAQSLVAGVHYTSIVRRDGRIAATGIGAANMHVAHLMRRLKSSPWFREQALGHIAAADGYGDAAAAFELAFRATPPPPPAE